MRWGRVTSLSREARECSVEVRDVRREAWDTRGADSMDRHRVGGVGMLGILPSQNQQMRAVFS